MLATQLGASVLEIGLSGSGPLSPEFTRNASSPRGGAQFSDWAQSIRLALAWGRSALYLSSIPMIAYIAPLNYLLAGPAQGDIDKVDPTRLYGEITAFAKTPRQLDRVPALALKGL